MKRMIDTEKFLDKLLYMGYMDEEKSEVEEVVNNMSEDAYNKDEVIDMLEKLKKVIESQPTYRMAVTDHSRLISYGYSEREPSAKDAAKHIQAKINALKAEQEK